MEILVGILVVCLVGLVASVSSFLGAVVPRRPTPQEVSKFPPMPYGVDMQPLYCSSDGRPIWI